MQTRGRNAKHLGDYSTGLAALLLALVPGACSRPAAPPDAADAAPNAVRKVLLISIDTLRADYLTPYDEALSTSPQFAELAADSVIFTDAMAQGGSTTPSHHSIFYGLYPWIHKATVGKQIPHQTPLPPMQVLRESGMRTVGFVGGGKVSDKFGFGDGFEIYENISRLRSDAGDKHAWEKQRIPVLEARANEWLDEHHAEDFFLFLHTYKVHCPYDPPEEIARKYTDSYQGGEYACGRKGAGERLDEAYVERIRALYAGEVEYVDAFLGRLIRRLKALSIYDETMIVILADHGELLGENNEIGHNSTHEACLRVPLLIRIPGLPPGRIDAPVELIDVMPTIFATVGAEAPYRFQGEDLLPVLRGVGTIDPERTRFASVSSEVAVRRGKWKLTFSTLDGRILGLHDMETAAAEEQDLAAFNADVVRELKTGFELMLEQNSDLSDQFVLPGDGQEPLVDEHLEEQLRTLGYAE